MENTAKNTDTPKRGEPLSFTAKDIDKLDRAGRVLEFQQPHPSGGNCRVQISMKKAIEFAKQVHPNQYESDEDALEDFKTIHWAYWTEPWKGAKHEKSGNRE